MLEGLNPAQRAAVTATEIGDGWVTYRDADGNTHRIECDSVVGLDGMEVYQQEAMALYPCDRDSI